MVRGARRADENVPNPTSVTGSPRRSEVRMAASIERRARSATGRVQPAAVAISTTSWLRVMRYMPMTPRASSMTSSVIVAYPLPSA